MSDELRSDASPGKETRAIAKFEKRGRYDYGGILKQEKYNYNLDLPIFLLETLKAGGLSQG